MSDWNVHGNPSERFPGWMMTKSMQEQRDMEVAAEHLRDLLPENCRTCVRALAYRVKPVSHRVVKDEISKEEAIDDVTQFGGDCPGGIKDESGIFIIGCPSVNRAEQEE